MKPDSINFGPPISLPHAMIRYIEVRANIAQHSPAHPSGPAVLVATWPTDPDRAATRDIECVKNVIVCVSQSSGNPSDVCPFRT